MLKRLRELEGDSAAAAAKDKVTVTASGKDGFSIKSADGKYVLRLRGYVQADGRFFRRRRALARHNTFFLRRARPILEATVGKYFGFRFMPDFGQGQHGALRRLLRRQRSTPGLRGSGWASSSRRSDSSACSRRTDIVFAERGLPTNLVPNRDIGLQLAGDFTSGCFDLRRPGCSTAWPTWATATAT